MAAGSRRLSLPVLKDALYQTSRTAAFIFGIFIGATVFAAVLRGLGGDDVIRAALTGLPFGQTGVLLTVLAITFLLGFFLDWVEITLIILPLVAPVLFSMGVDPLWFAILFALCLQTSFLTPPVASRCSTSRASAHRASLPAMSTSACCPISSSNCSAWPWCSISHR